LKVAELILVQVQEQVKLGDWGRGYPPLAAASVMTREEEF